MSVVWGTAELLGMRSVIADVGVGITLQLSSDATAAIGMGARLGSEKSDTWPSPICGCNRSAGADR